MSDRQRAALKWALYGAAYLITFFFASCVFSRYPMHGAVPQMAPVAVAVVAVFEGSLGGSIFGLCVGFFACMSQYGVGPSMILCCTLIGLFAGLLQTGTLGKSLLGSIPTALGGMLAVEIVRVAGALISHRGSVGILLRLAGFETLYSMILLLPAYPLFRFVYRRFGAGG